MFQKTRIRLTLLNASVLFVILASLGSGMYLYLRTEIMSQIDRTMQNRAQIYNIVVPRVQFFNPDAIDARIQEGMPGFRFEPGTGNAPAPQVISRFARNIHVLMWNQQQMLIEDFVAEQYPSGMIEKLGRLLHHTKPFTFRYDGAAYRILNVMAAPDMPALRIGVEPAIEVGHYQLVSNINTEVNMLNTVLGLIIFGIVIGGGISVIAGLYLADKALVPIRSSWNKQQQFIADASHELRTPLAVLHTHTELLLRHPDHTIEQDSREISTILKEIRRMKKLVNGLLTLTQSDAERMELQMKPLAIDGIIIHAARQFAPLAALKRIELTWEADSGAVVSGDEERLQQLLLIILDNAIKYTREQGTIHISCIKSANAVLIQVKDNGIGIPAAELPQIFERFYRGDKVRNRTDGGTGLGLAIAKWIVTLHNGKIHADSDTNAGMIMTVTLPLI
ncbi:sensor histidine kinase [Paenibacillus tarimensis]